MEAYAGHILFCNLADGTTTSRNTSDYTDLFLGGRGLAARLYWDRSPWDISVFDPANPFIIATGPLCGFTGLAGSRWQVCSKSPSVAPESFSYANLGGSFGAVLKFAGFDAVVIQGRAERPTFLFIHDGKCEFKDAAHLTGQGSAQVREILRAQLGEHVRVMAIGPAGEHLVPFSSLLAEDDASGSGGFAAVLGSKRLKAIAVVGDTRPQAADPVRLQELTAYLRRKKRERPQETPSPPEGMRGRRRACFGCIAGCPRARFETADGKQGKYLCDSGIFYEARSEAYYGALNEVPFFANRLCDDYGLDTNVMDAMIGWLERCHREGILSEKLTGLPLSKIGSHEFIEALVRSISNREDFGGVLALGLSQAARQLGRPAEEQLRDAAYFDGTILGSCPRMYVTSALLYALEPRQSLPILGEVGGTVIRWLDSVNGTDDPEVDDDDLMFIAKHFWGGEEAADFSSLKGKALAAKMIQDRWYAKESAILCSFSWHVSAIERFRPPIVAEILCAVTGGEYDEGSVMDLGERIFNLQRAIQIRERRVGRAADVLPEFWHSTPLSEAFMNPDLIAPGPDMRPISRKGVVLRKADFERLKDEYYQLRGWNVATGLTYESRLNKLGLAEVATELGRQDLQGQTRAE